MSLPRPFRSVLYIPGSKDRAINKARNLPADAIIFDLEDAVAIDEKANARETLTRELGEGGFGHRYRIVRINGLDTIWGKLDAETVAKMDCDAVLLPKVESAAQLDALAAITGDLPIWAMMETPMGMLNAREIAEHPKLEGMVMGTNDLVKDLNARATPDRVAVMTSLGLCVLAAKAFGVTVIDGVYNAFKDEEGLRVECTQGRDMGFDGKTLIHPAQIDTSNDVFGPSDDEIDLARRQIEAFEVAQREGQGVAVVDGRIVENLHVDTARRVLAKAEAINQIAAE